MTIFEIALSVTICIVAFLLICTALVVAFNEAVACRITDRVGRMIMRVRKPKYAKGGVSHGKMDYKPEEGEWVIPLKQMRRVMGLREIAKRHKESEGGSEHRMEYGRYNQRRSNNG